MSFNQKMRCKACYQEWDETIPCEEGASFRDAFINHDPACPSCNSKNVTRKFLVGGIACNDADMKFSRMYPYVSSTLPAEHPLGRNFYGPMKKTVIESREHEKEFERCGYKRL